jgi:hypothetical protein
MPDQFQLFAPGGPCDQPFPLNPVHDEYSLARIFPLAVQVDGITQLAVLPAHVLHPQLAARVGSQQAKVTLDNSLRAGSSRALISQWRAAPPTASTPASQAPGSTPSTTEPAASLLPDLPMALYLPYRQTWELLGYSRGALLNSVSLAPQEETTIEVFTWDRVKRSREVAESVEQESSQDATFTDKDSREVLKELTKDSSFTFHAGLNVQIPTGSPVTVGGQVETRTQESMRDVSRATQQIVNESVRKASTRKKTSRQTKMTETEEFGTETRVTRKLRNPNQCRTLNIDHFEVLANYRVTTGLLPDQARLCVLIDNPMQLQATRLFVLANEGVLRRVLLSSVYTAGFEAARLLATWERRCEVTCTSPCPCQTTGTPPTGNPAVDAARQRVTEAADLVSATINTINAAQPDALIALGKECSTAGGEAAWANAKSEFHRWLYARLMDTVAPRWWTACRQFSAEGADHSPDASERFLFTANIQPADIFNVIVLTVTYYAKAVEFIGSLGSRPGMNICAGWVLATNVAFDDAGLDAAIGQLRSAVAAYRAAVATAITPPPSGTPATPPPAPPAPEFAPRDLSAALVSEAALLTHLTANESYYRFALWQALSPAGRAARLESLPDLMGLVENEVLGLVGDKLAVAFRVAADPNVRSWFEGNVLNNPGFQQDVAQPFTVVLPTPGVTLESRLGQCDACEQFIVQHRALDLQQKSAEVVAAQQRAEQEKLETQRYQARLSQKQPLLEDPDQNLSGIRVILEGQPKVVPPSNS